MTSTKQVNMSAKIESGIDVLFSVSAWTIKVAR